jgi:ribulose-phosphate 3-epimerase
MDGRFVPNITLGPLVIEAIRRATAKPLNVHLMMVEPERMLDDFVKAGADHLLVQCEPASTIHLHRVLSRIRELGVKAGVVIDPGSPIAFVEHVLHLCDVVLVMTVNPGFGGQKYIATMEPKIREAAAMIEESGFAIDLEVDGGISPDTIAGAAAAGARVLVAGSALYKHQGGLTAAVTELRRLAEAALAA